MQSLMKSTIDRHTQLIVAICCNKAQITYRYDNCDVLKKRSKQYFNSPRRGRKIMFYKFCEANVLEAIDIQIKTCSVL